MAKSGNSLRSRVIGIGAVAALVALPLGGLSARASSGEVYNLQVSGCPASASVGTPGAGAIKGGTCQARKCIANDKYGNTVDYIFIQLVDNSKQCWQGYYAKFYDYDKKTYHYVGYGNTQQTINDFFPGGFCGGKTGQQVVWVKFYLCVDGTKTKCVAKYDYGPGASC
ncbi:MAG: hypothetical protein ACJ735_14225 [Actinomycetes bacterium]